MVLIVSIITSIITGLIVVIIIHRSWWSTHPHRPHRLAFHALASFTAPRGRPVHYIINKHKQPLQPTMPPVIWCRRFICFLPTGQPAASKESINRRWRSGARRLVLTRQAGWRGQPPLLGGSHQPRPATQQRHLIGRRWWLRAASCRHRGRHLSPPCACSRPVDEQGLEEKELVMMAGMTIGVGGAV